CSLLPLLFPPTPDRAGRANAPRCIVAIWTVVDAVAAKERPTLDLVSDRWPELPMVRDDGSVLQPLDPTPPPARRCRAAQRPAAHREWRARGDRRPATAGRAARLRRPPPARLRRRRLRVTEPATTWINTCTTRRRARYPTG